jgi:uncharacterized membrane protein
VAKAPNALNEATAKGPADKVTQGAARDRLSGDIQNLAGAAATFALSSMVRRLDGVTDRLTDYAEKGGPSLMSAVTGDKQPGGGLVKTMMKQAVGAPLRGVKDKLKGAVGGGKKGGGKQPKVTNIVETVDVGVPVRVAYDQWTRFTDFPSFTKKVEDVQQPSDERVVWRAKIFWSRREWESTIIDQVPDQRIVWRSKGAKGHVDGAVTFHELAPELTRIILVLEYFPKGLFEQTGNIWRAQGRRARLELKHFKRHAMTRSLLHSEEIEGWRGEIRDGEVIQHDAAEAAEYEETENAENAENGEETVDESPDEGAESERGKARSRPRRRAAGTARERGDADDTTKSRRPARSSTRRASGSRAGTRSAATDKD